MVTTKYALITSATSGLRLEPAKLFVKDNYNLVIVARDEQELNKTLTELKEMGTSKFVGVVKNLFKPDIAIELFEGVKAMITIEILTNDAGQQQYGKFIDNDVERELDII